MSLVKRREEDEPREELVREDEPREELVREDEPPNKY